MNKENFTKYVKEVLYKFDPADTSCNLNNIFDEYSSEAHMIAELVFNCDMLVRHSIQKVFNDQFNGHYDEDKLLDAYADINEKLL